MVVQARSVDLIHVGVRELQVTRADDVAVNLRRVTLTGPQLQEFADSEGNVTAPFSSPNFDDDIRLLFPYPGEQEPVLPVIKDGRVTFAPGRKPIARAYTVRNFRPETLELDVDVVLHGHGVASTWATSVSPGNGYTWLARARP